MTKHNRTNTAISSAVKNILPAAFALFLITGCQDGKDKFDNKIFYDATGLKTEIRVAVDEQVETMTTPVTIAVAQPMSTDLNIDFKESPELLETYRKAYYDPEAELLPSDHYDMTTLKGVISAGAVSTGEIDFKFMNLKEGQGLDYSKKYVLPVTISAQGIDVLERSKTMYFVVRKASLVNVAPDMASNCAWPDWETFSQVEHLENFTLEALVLGRAFNNESQVHTIMGVEDHFLIRSGDAGMPGNQIQVAWAYKDEKGKTFRGGLTGSNMQLKPDVWYHLAVTFDGGEDHPEGAEIKVYFNGKLRQSKICSAEDDNKKQVPIKEVNFMVKHSDESNGKPRCFWIGYSYDKDRSFQGMMSEVRLWNKALTEDELNAKNHFYKLYPEAETGLFTEDLLAYWRFSEGKGGVIKDLSVYGHDLKADHDFVWYPVDLPIE